MKVKLLIDDPAGRFKAGEIGHVLPNNSSKYDYFVELSGKIKIDNFLGRGPISVLRRYYFYKNEVEEIDVASNRRTSHDS